MDFDYSGGGGGYRNNGPRFQRGRGRGRGGNNSFRGRGSSFGGRGRGRGMGGARGNMFSQKPKRNPMTLYAPRPKPKKSRRCEICALTASYTCPKTGSAFCSVKCFKALRVRPPRLSESERIKSETKLPSNIPDLPAIPAEFNKELCHICQKEEGRFRAPKSRAKYCSAPCYKKFVQNPKFYAKDAHLKRRIEMLEKVEQLRNPTKTVETEKSSNEPGAPVTDQEEAGTPQATPENVENEEPVEVNIEEKVKEIAATVPKFDETKCLVCQKEEGLYKVPKSKRKYCSVPCYKILTASPDEYTKEAWKLKRAEIVRKLVEEALANPGKAVAEKQEGLVKTESLEEGELPEERVSQPNLDKVVVDTSPETVLKRQLEMAEEKENEIAAKRARDRELRLKEEDVVPKPLLAYLEKDVAMKNLLKNKRLRDLLTNMQDAVVGHRFNMIEQALQNEPVFREYADACLNIICPDEEAVSAGQSADDTAIVEALTADE